MSSWVPMENISTNILEMMARSQGVELPPEVLNPPPPPSIQEQLSRQEPVVTPAATGGSGSRSSTPKRSSFQMTNEEYMSKVDLSAGLVSTKKRARPVSPAKQRIAEQKKKELDEDDYLYFDDDTEPNAAPGKQKSAIAGSQYLDEPLEPEEEDDDVTILEPEPVVNTAASASAPAPAAEPIRVAELQPIPLLGDGDDDYVTAANNVNDDNNNDDEDTTEIEERKRPISVQAPAAWLSDIPGLGSPEPEQPPDDPIVDSVTEPTEDSNAIQEPGMTEDRKRIGEEEDEIGMFLPSNQELAANNSVNHVNSQPEEAETSAFEMATAMFSPVKKQPEKIEVPDEQPETEVSESHENFNYFTENSAPDEVHQESVNTVAASITPAAVDEESESPSTRVTRSAAKGSSSPSKSSSPSSASSSSGNSVPPVKIRLVPVSSGTGLTYEVKPNDSQAMKVVIKKTSAVVAPAVAPVSHPILVEKKSPSPSTTTTKRAAAGTSGNSIANKKKKTASSSNSVTNKSNPTPCQNCGKPSVVDNMWDSEYCSHQCVFYYVKKVFQKMFPPKDQKPIKSSADTTASSSTVANKKPS